MPSFRTIAETSRSTTFLACSSLLLCMHCGSSPPPGNQTSYTEVHRLAPAPAPAPTPTPANAVSVQATAAADARCELATTRRQTIVDSVVTPKADFVVVLRDGGCLETWKVAEKRQVAQVHTGVVSQPGAATHLEMMPGSIVVVDKRSAFDAISLTPATMPLPTGGNVLRDDPSVGIQKFSPTLSKALAQWAPKVKATLRIEEGTTWIDPNTDDSSGIEHQVGISEDGKLFFADTKLIRLDTGKVRDFAIATPRPARPTPPPPAKPIRPPAPVPPAPTPPMPIAPTQLPPTPEVSEEAPTWTVHIELGPRSDRAIVSWVTHDNDGNETTTVSLVDTNTMKTISTVVKACDWPNATWSPKGKWMLYQRCHDDTGALVEEARAVDTGKLVRRVPSRNFHFADDDETGVALGVVKNLGSNAVLFEVPKRGPSWTE